MDNGKPKRTFEQIFMDVNWRLGIVTGLRVLNNLLGSPAAEMPESQAAEDVIEAFKAVDEDSMIHMIRSLNVEIREDVRELLIRFPLSKMTESMRDATLRMVDQAGGFEDLFHED